MPNDAKLGLLAGVAAVIVVAVISSKDPTPIGPVVTTPGAPLAQTPTSVGRLSPVEEAASPVSKKPAAARVTSLAAE